MSDEWWATDTEVEVDAGKKPVRKPAELDEVDKYRMPKTINAKWIEAQLSKAEWSRIKRTPNATKLNPHLIESMCMDARKGLSKRSIMSRAGYHVVNWGRWEQKAAQGEQPYALWYQCMLLSISQVEEELIKNVRLASMEDWKAAKWLLEMHNKEEYSAAPTTQITNIAGDVQATENSVNYMTEDDALKVAKLLQSFGAVPQIDNVVEGEVVEDEDSDS
jgi:hypothetical protein